MLEKLLGWGKRQDEIVKLLNKIRLLEAENSNLRKEEDREIINEDNKSCVIIGESGWFSLKVGGHLVNLSFINRNNQLEVFHNVTSLK